MTSKKIEHWPSVLEISADLGLPNVEETTSYGQPCLKAHKKNWVWCSPHEDAFVFKVSDDERDVLVAVDSERYFITDHYVGYGMILVRPDQLDVAWAKANMARVWREQAGKRFLQRFDAEKDHS